uniref:Aspartyl beta-hydroxylase/Triadin domain-containing protein n=1 Tax=Pelusios castaneus TaxID=367368 RepID=A0A8C8SQP8_9SAUR
MGRGGTSAATARARSGRGRCWEHPRGNQFFLGRPLLPLRARSSRRCLTDGDMPPRNKSSKGAGSSPSQGSRRETKHGGNKNGKKEGLSGSSFFTWFMVIALLGVWTSVAVVWFELVDYEEVLAKAKDFRYNLSEVLQGKLGLYDADGDGDFDVEDAKVLLGLKERSVPAQPTPAEYEESIHPAEQSFIKSEHKNVEAELEEEIQSILHEALHSQLGEKHDGVNEQAEKVEVHEEVFEMPPADDLYSTVEDEMPEVLETPEPVQEETDSHDQAEEHGVDEPEAIEIPDDYNMDVEEPTYEPEVPGDTELGHEDAFEHHREDAVHQDYEEEHEPNYGEETEIQDTVYAELETGETEETADREPVNEHYYEESIQEPTDDAGKEDETTEVLLEPIKEDTETEEEEHTEDYVFAAPQETDVPVQAENYSNDDLVDT